MAGLGIDTGVVTTAAGAAAKAAASSISGLLFQVALSRFTTGQDATPADPVIYVTEEIKEVLRLYRQAFTDSGVEDRHNEILRLPEGVDRIPADAWIRQYLLLPGLRRPVTVAAEFRPIVDSIVGKLKIFNSMRNRGWFAGPTAWDTTAPIKNYPLIVFLLLAITVSAAGDSIREMDIDIGIKIATAAERFCVMIMSSERLRRPTPSNENEIVLNHILSPGEPDALANGIRADLISLKKIFISRKSRMLFQNAAKKGNTALYRVTDKIDRYFMSWLYGNQDPGIFPSLQEIYTAVSLLARYPDYTGRHGFPTEPRRDEANFIATIQKICNSSTRPVDVYWMLRVFFLPVTLDRRVTLGANIEETITGIIAENMYIYSNEALKHTFVEKMKALLATITFRVDPVGIGITAYNPPAFTPDENNRIAENLWQVCLLRHKVKIILEVGKELHYIAVMLGAFAGAYIPELATYFTTLLEQVRSGLAAFKTMLEANNSLRHFGHLKLHALMNGIMQEFVSLDAEFTEIIHELRFATEGNYLAEMTAELRMRLEKTVRQLGILFPHNRENFERELNGVMSRVVSITGPLVTEATVVAMPRASEASVARIVAENQERFSNLLLTEGNLAVINKAYDPVATKGWSNGAFKRDAAIAAKAELETFFRERPYIRPQQGAALLEKSSFANPFCTREDLLKLYGLFSAICLCSKDPSKHKLLDDLNIKLTDLNIKFASFFCTLPAAPGLVTATVGVAIGGEAAPEALPVVGARAAPDVGSLAGADVVPAPGLAADIRATPAVRPAVDVGVVPGAGAFRVVEHPLNATPVAEMILTPAQSAAANQLSELLFGART
jgi:hypothetical protein